MSIDVELTGGVAVITINRPERMNAMDAEAYAALSEAWVRVRDDHVDPRRGRHRRRRAGVHHGRRHQESFLTDPGGPAGVLEHAA